MKKLKGCIIGIFLAVLVIGVYNFYIIDKMDDVIVENKETVRNTRTYERFWSHDVNKDIMDDNTLMIFGSSELMSLEDYKVNVSSFLNNDSINVQTIGAGYFQSLNHAICLGSLGDELKGKKVALFLSPQWFAEQGVTTEDFPSRYGEEHLLYFLSNDKIDKKTKMYVLNRLDSLLISSPMQHNRLLRYKQWIEEGDKLDGAYAQFMKKIWTFKDKQLVYKSIEDYKVDLPKISEDELDFDKILRIAEKQGEKACTNNEFGIDDEYWDTYVKETYENGPVKDKQEIYTESPEYEDLKLFLNLSKDLGVEVMLVNIPINKLWGEYVGQECNKYYSNIREISKKYDNVTLIDMSKYEKEKYFFRDIMHIGWKGWARINEALYTEFKK